MDAAISWFDNYEKKSGTGRIERRIYIATDEPNVVFLARRMLIYILFLCFYYPTFSALASTFSLKDKMYPYACCVFYILNIYAI